MALLTAILLWTPAFSFAKSRRLEAVSHFFRSPGVPDITALSAESKVWRSENDREERELREQVRAEAARLGFIEHINLAVSAELDGPPAKDGSSSLRIKAMVLANVFARFFDKEKEIPTIEARIKEPDLQSVSKLILEQALETARALRTMAGAGSEIRAPSSEFEPTLSYRLKSFRGREASYNPDAIHFHVGVTPTAEERLKYAKAGILDSLVNKHEYDIGRLILFHVRQLAHETGIGDHEVDVYMIADQTPGLSATER